MALTAVDRHLVQRCLNHEPGAWNDFVDRYLGLIYHVIHYTAHLRSFTLHPEDVEDLAAEILAQIVANEYAIFRHFAGRSSLATYLTVIARRITVHELARRAAAARNLPLVNGEKLPEHEAPPKLEAGLDTLEEVQHLLARLPKRTRQVVRLFYLEGRSYEEISTQLHIPVNTIGPILSRAKQQLRERMAERTAGGSKHARRATPAEVHHMD